MSARSENIYWSLLTLVTNFPFELKAKIILSWLAGGGGLDGWVAGLSETKTKPSPLLKLELKLGLSFATDNSKYFP